MTSGGWIIMVLSVGFMTGLGLVDLEGAHHPGRDRAPPLPGRHRPRRRRAESLPAPPTACIGRSRPAKSIEVRAHATIARRVPRSSCFVASGGGRCCTQCQPRAWDGVSTRNASSSRGQRHTDLRDLVTKVTPVLHPPRSIARRSTDPATNPANSTSTSTSLARGGRMTEPNSDLLVPAAEVGDLPHVAAQLAAKPSDGPEHRRVDQRERPAFDPWAATPSSATASEGNLPRRAADAEHRRGRCRDDAAAVQLRRVVGLLASISIMTGLLGWSIWRVVTTPGSEEHIHSQAMRRRRHPIDGQPTPRVVEVAARGSRPHSTRFTSK